jgi:uncharacterized protein YjiS (DUF1127 family)
MTGLAGVNATMPPSGMPAIVHTGAMDRVLAAVHAWRASRRRDAVKAAIVVRLSTLDERMLADIGVNRSDIDAVAERGAGPRQAGSLAILSALLHDLVVEPVRAHFRRESAGRDLMRLDDRLLRDIGLTRADLYRLRTGQAEQVVTEQPSTTSRQIQREAARTLHALDDRMLADIGVVRGHIEEVAEELAAKTRRRPANTDRTARAA